MPAGVCAEADGYTEYDDFLPIVTDYYSIDGVLQPGSFNLGTALLYYETAITSKPPVSIPMILQLTLAEVRDAARAIKEAGVVDQPLVLNLTPFIVEFWTTGAGAPVVDNENGGVGARRGRAPSTTTPPAKTLELLAEMNEEGLINPVPGVEGQFDHFFAMGDALSSRTWRPGPRSRPSMPCARAMSTPAELDLENELTAIDVDLDTAEFRG